MGRAWVPRFWGRAAACLGGQGLGILRRNKVPFCDRGNRDSVVEKRQKRCGKRRFPESSFFSQKLQKQRKTGTKRLVSCRFCLVRVAGFEPTASWSRTMRATNCATPGCRSFRGINPSKVLIHLDSNNTILPYLLSNCKPFLDFLKQNIEQTLCAFRRVETRAA